jgi:proteasome lid subunit RPN8/RPN11
MRSIICTCEVLAETIGRLREGGKRSEERVVLWLAKASAPPPTRVVEVYEPEQVTAIDYFRLPPPSMRALMSHLRALRRKVVAQVHSHPGRAFHSKVDDEWAIVRHVGALSLVLPRFAGTTTASNFLDEAMTYELSPKNTWLLIPNRGAAARLEIRS